MSEEIDPGTLRGLRIQRLLGAVCAVWLIPLLTGVMRWVLRYRIKDHRELRRQYRRLLAESDRPLLICGNHLTMVDSALITWAIGSSFFYATRFKALPWNLPERRNFASIAALRVLVYLLKCIPIVRGGKRSDVAQVLGCAEYLMSRGEPVMIFPEGGRSRTGRVDVDAAAHGVGRLIGALEGCRVLCVYLRGDHQATWSTIPAPGETFSVRLSLLEVSSPHTGMRRSRHYAQQVVQHLAAMEERLLAEQQPDIAHRQAPMTGMSPASEH